MDPQSIYVQLGRLAENIPAFQGKRPFPVNTHKWLAHLYALLLAAGHNDDATRIRHLTTSMAPSASDSEVHEVYSILFRILAITELEAPAPTQGAFIPVGNAFDALMAIGNVFKEASTDLLVVDPYMDEKALTDYALQVPEGVSIRLLSDSKDRKPTLEPAAKRWITQYAGKRPLAVRLAPHRALHDRLIITDSKQVWVLTQSLNAFAARSPASITRTDEDTALLKIDAYQTMWQSAVPI